MAFAPASAAFFSFIEKYSIWPSTSLPLSTSTMASSAPTRSSTFPYPPRTISPVIGSSRPGEPTIGITVYCSLPISSVATKLVVMLLYVAPTVIAPGLPPGLPMVLGSGPSFPAATTTKTPSSTAWFTARSIFGLVVFTPRLMFITSAPSLMAMLTALAMRSDDTPSPSSDTLYARILALGAIPVSSPSAAIIPATWVP